MRNLCVFRERKDAVQLTGSEKLIAAAIDSDNDRIFFASDCCKLYWVGLSSDAQHLQHSLPLFEGAIIDIEYLMELEALILGMENGELVLVNPSSGLIEVVGTVQGGIINMAASPDGEVLAVGTGVGQLLLMTLDWKMLHEFTVYNGRNDAEAAAIGPGGLEICWRADGKYFATNQRSQTLDQSIVNVWERESGTLHAGCGALPSSETAITWCHSGARIAAVCSRSKIQSTPSLIVFERNGLKKDSFKISAPPGAIVEAVRWNASGDLLSVQFRWASGNGVQLWSCSNYHWYLKQEWLYSVNDPVSFMWHPENAYCAICWTGAGCMELRNIGWISAVLEDATACVVNGQSILVTPLSVSLMPPPMHLVEIKFPSAVNAVAFKKGFVAVSLSDGSVGIAYLPGDSQWDDLEGSQIEGSLLKNLEGDVINAHLRLLTLVRVHLLFGLSGPDFAHEFELVEKGHDWIAESECKHVVGQSVVAVVATHSDRPEVLIQQDDGSIMSCLLGSASISAHVASFATSSPWMQIVGVNGLLIGLDEGGNLQLGQKLIADDCASFTLHVSSTSKAGVAHLVYTTKHDLLYVVRLEGGCSGSREVVDLSFLASSKVDEKENHLKVQRVWERNARLIGSLVGSDTAVILETARGNLETVFPRCLVFEAIVTSLEEHKFQQAILCARRHRIDLNVIVELIGETEFCLLANEFVNQVDNLSLVTELVCSLKNENVLESVYSHVLPPKVHNKLAGSKIVHHLVSALRSALEKLLLTSCSKDLEICILTTLARDDPPLLEEALKNIRKIRESELDVSDSDASGGGATLDAESALKHLIWLAGSDAVFDSALGLYDLHLAAMVASHSQRDPKEFLPFLQQLEAMPSCVMRYKIDYRLQKLSSALRNLGLGGEEYYDECLEVMKKHPELYVTGVSMGSDKWKKMAMEAWGDYLLGCGNNEDAGVAYCACGNVKNAMSAYVGGGYWQAALALAGELNISNGERRSIAGEMMESLKAMGRPKEAARIALDYLDDIEEGISLLIDARDWIEVVRICHLGNRKDMIKERVEACATECADGLMTEFEERIEKLGKYNARLLAVQQRRVLMESKITDARHDGQGDEDTDSDLDSTSSETSSNLSGMSAYTRGSRQTASSSKGKKRRKQGRIRAGSKEEEGGLVDHMMSMAMSDGICDELKSLLQVLVFVRKEDVAVKLEKTVLKFQAAHVQVMQQHNQQVPSTKNWHFNSLATS